MNQILDYNPMGSTGNNNGPKVGTDKIIKVFAILLIFFAICIIGIGLFNKLQNKANTGTDNEEAKAKIDVDISSEDSSLKIAVANEKALTKLVYNWNTNPEKTIEITSGKNFETKIDIPAGKNTLNIQVFDVDGKITEYSEEIDSDSGVDIINPVINFEVTEDKKIKITATDETALDFITYRWNQDQETKISATEDNPKEIVTEIEIAKGENNLTILAVDKANHTESKQQIFTGLTQPNVQVVLSEDRSKLVVTCSHENGVSKIQYDLNDKPYYAELQDLPKDVTFEQPLEPGYNKIILTVTSKDGTTTTFGGECTYTPPQEDITISE